MKEIEKDFYADLKEEQGKKKGGCSCLMVGIFFLVVLVAVEVVIFSLARGIKSNPSDQATPAIAIDQKFSKVDTGDGSFRVSITEGVLCSRLLSDPGFKDKNIFCAIDTDGIRVSGKLSPLLPDRVQAKIVPSIKSESLVFGVDEVRIGETKIPNMLPGLSGTVQDKVLEDVPELKGAKIKSIDLEPGVVVISANSKI